MIFSMGGLVLRTSGDVIIEKACPGLYLGNRKPAQDECGNHQYFVQTQVTGSFVHLHRSARYLFTITMTTVGPKDSLLYKNFQRHPAVLLESGSGIYLNAADGRRILDATSGAAVACLGYSDRDVQKAMVQQLTNLSYCHPGFYKTKAAEDLAAFLVQSTGGRMSKAVICGSG